MSRLPDPLPRHEAGVAAAGPATLKTVHATCVVLDEKAALILGPSGSGKSTLALELMALGAYLVADDQVVLTRKESDIFASCPAALSGRIEARRIGILRAETVAEAKVQLVIDLTEQEEERLPPVRKIEMLGITIDLVVAGKHGHLAAAILQYLKAGRAD